MNDKDNTTSNDSTVQAVMNPSTVTWCGTARKCLTDIEKAVLFHKHEAKRNKFFNNPDRVEYHNYMAQKIQGIL